MKTRMMMIVAMVGVIAMAGTAEAQDYTFDGGPGGAGTDWDTGTNWDPDNPPGGLTSITDDLIVGGSFSPTKAAGGVYIGNGAPGSLTIDTTGTLTLPGYVGVGSTHGGTMTLTNGTVDVGYGFNTGWGTTARVDIDGGELNVNSFFLSDDGNNNDATIEQTGGDVNLCINPAVGHDYVTLGFGVGSTCTWSISGGSFSILSGGKLYLGAHGAGVGNGTGVFEVIGTGPTSITMAILDAEPLATCTGTLRFETDAGPGGVTPITVTSSVDVSDADLVVDFSTPPGPGDILLIDNQGVGPIGGTFTGLPEGAPVGAYTLSYFGGVGGNDLVLEVAPVPEPAGLGLIGLALLAVRKRRS